MSEISTRTIAIIGFGEAGSILGADLAATGREVLAYDILLDSAASREALQDRARAAKVRLGDSSSAAIRGAALVISAVTASSAAEVAAEAARTIRPGQVFLDI